MQKFLTRAEDDNSEPNAHRTANALVEDEEREPARRKRTKKAMLTELLRDSKPRLVFYLSNQCLFAIISNNLFFEIKCKLSALFLEFKFEIKLFLLLCNY